MFSITKLFTKISQKQIFPELWCMLLLGFDFKLTSLQKCCILPNWSDSFFETMQKGAIWHCSWSSQMLINHPKVLNLYHWQIKIWIQNSVFILTVSTVSISISSFSSKAWFFFALNPCSLILTQKVCAFYNFVFSILLISFSDSSTWAGAYGSGVYPTGLFSFYAR